MDQSLSALYKRFRVLSLLVVTGLMMLMSFLWYLPGAYHAKTMDEYHAYSWRELRFTNILDLYVLHNLDKNHGPNFILAGIGLDYPTLLSIFIRATASLGVSDGVTTENYRNSTPPAKNTPPTDTSTPIGVGNDAATGAAATNNVPAYLLTNYAAIFVFGLITIWLLARWPGSKPWLFAASPVLLLFTGYNWDTIPMALTLAGLLLLKRSTDKPDQGRGYSLFYEVAGFSVLTIAIWFKLFPIVFLGAALIDRARRRQWKTSGMGVILFVALSVLINLPAALSNHTSWSFWVWFNQHRPVEPSSIWFLLFGGMDLAFPLRPDTTVAINFLSLFFVACGGLVIAALGWQSRRRDIIMPMGCLLLLWWFTFNKIYDPNFDLWLVFILAILGAPRWLYLTLIPLSFTWYITAMTGLSLLTLGASPQIDAWYVGHVLMFMIIWRLAVLVAMIGWVGRKLLTAEQAVEKQVAPAETVEEPEARRAEMMPVLQQ